MHNREGGGDSGEGGEGGGGGVEERALLRPEPPTSTPQDIYQYYHDRPEDLSPVAVSDLPNRTVARSTTVDQPKWPAASVIGKS